MAHSGPLTVTDLLAAASEILEKGDYVRVEEKRIGQWPTTAARVFEDEYSIVAVVIYESWAELSTSWIDAQAALGELMSKYLTRVNAKSWEGYLVLLTPSVADRSGRLDLDKIRYDTARVRKLVGTGDELSSTGDVERVLLPVLPLKTVQAQVRDSVLELLPSILARRGIPEEATLTVIQALYEHQSVIERLHSRRDQA